MCVPDMNENLCIVLPNFISYSVQLRRGWLGYFKWELVLCKAQKLNWHKIVNESNTLI